MSSYADLSHTEKAKADTLILTLHGQFPSAPLALLEEVAAEAVENGESEAVAADHLRARLGIATEAPPAAFEMVLRQIDVGVVCTLFDFLRTFLDQPGALVPRVLVLGDGDLSFSRSLQTQLCLGPRLTATVFNPSDTPPDLRDNKRWLQGAGVEVREGVDVMRLQPDLAQPRLFDVVIFNFPHNGLNAHSEVKWGNKKLNVETHNYLLERYFAMSKSVLKPHGFAVVSVKRQKPYVWWNTREIGSLFFSDCKQLRFDPGEFREYRHTRTLPRQRQVETKKASSFVFYRPTLTDRVRSDYDYQRILQRALAAQRRLPPVDWSSSEDEEDADGIDEHIVYQPEADGALW